MTRVFDPYHKWLGIPPEEQPPSHYRLLGLTDLESDPDVIQAAADQRMAHLRTYQTGQYADWSQRLLNEVATARICLLNPARKAAYDRQLQETKRPAAQPPEPAPPVQPFVIVVDEVGPKASSTLRARKHLPLGSLITGLVTLAGALILGLVYWNATPPEEQVTVAKPADVDTQPITEVAKRPTDEGAATKPLVRDTVETEKHDERPIVATNGDAAASSNATRTEDASATKPAQPRLFVKPDATPPETTGDDFWDKSDTTYSETQPNSSEPRANEPSSTESDTSLSDRTEPESMPSDRVAVPTAAAQDEAMKLARDLYREEFSKSKTADEKLTLAKKLLAQAEASTSADAGTFVLLRLAKEIALQASNGETAFAAIDLMAERYRIDAVGMKAELLSAYAKKARAAPQHLSIAEQASRLLDEASAAGDYTLAVTLAKLTASEAALGRNKELVQWAKNNVQDLQKKVKLATGFETARRTLATQPDDPPANVLVGSYYAFLEERWEKALPCLAKGDDADLQSLAKRELESPTNTVEIQLALADAWWEAGQSAEGMKRLALLRHAVSWYARAQSDALSGLNKIKVEKRMGELAKAEHDAAPTGPVPKLVAPVGKWFSLLPSPNQLTGWDADDCRYTYVNRIIDLQQRDMYCPIITKDVSIRAKVRRVNAPCMRLIVRNSEQGCYIAQLTSSNWSIIKSTRSQQNLAPGQIARWGEERTLKSIGVTHNYSDVIFEMGFSVLGNTLTVFLNQQPLLQAQDATFTEGSVGIGTTNSTGLYVTDVELLIPNKGSLVGDRRIAVTPTKMSNGH